MTAPTRLAAAIAVVVTFASLALVLTALGTDTPYADSRLLPAGWVLVPAVGVAAYLRLRWGLLAAAGTGAAPLVAVVAGASASLLPALVAAGAVGLAVLVGHLARLAERHEHA
ncbi:hypothetical protein [Nocardioides sp.]|uniref:hypothetical protein n=1 Tax=Nocardioides sp. TaxID=35761 RepID=UPI003527516A